MKRHTLQNTLRITCHRATCRFVAVLFGHIVDVYVFSGPPDLESVRRFDFRRRWLSGGFRLHLGLFGVRVQPFRLTCPCCGGEVKDYGDDGQVCSEPNCVFVQFDE